jgi:hypothetical protein
MEGADLELIKGIVKQRSVISGQWSGTEKREQKAENREKRKEKGE